MIETSPSFSIADGHIYIYIRNIYVMIETSPSFSIADGLNSAFYTM